jgi:hypothetical protein
MGAVAIRAMVACRGALLSPVSRDVSVLTFSQKETRFLDRDVPGSLSAEVSSVDGLARFRQGGIVEEVV